MSSKGQECSNYKKLGHFRRMCKSTDSRRSSINDNEAYPDHRSHDRDVSWTETSETNRLEQVGTKVFCHVKFEGYTSKWLVDTGSAYSVMNVGTAFELGLTELIRPEEMEMISYTGEKLEISGELSWRNKSHRTKIIVTEEGRNLMGLEDCNKLGIVV